MKRQLVFYFVVLTTTVFGQATKVATTTKYHKAIITDLNNDNVMDTITLNSSVKEDWQYNKLTIALTGFAKQTFIAKDAWGDVDSTFMVNNKNAVASKDLFIQKAKDHSTILLFGWLSGAGYRTEFSIVNIKNNKASMVFDFLQEELDIEIPVELTDLDKDGRTDFVYRNMFEYYQSVDSLNADIGTYSPYLVYTIDNDCTLNKPLTKKYNEDNFVFAGYEYSEEIKILFPRDKSKPKVIK